MAKGFHFIFFKMDKKRVVFDHHGKKYEKVFEINSILYDFPENIRNSLLHGLYKITSHVSEENLLLYLDYMEDHRQMPKIEYNNIYDLHLLDSEFHLLTNTFQSFDYQQLLKFAYLNKIISNQNQDYSLFSSYIAQNSDYYIENYPEELSGLSINVLNSIFSNPKRILQNHEAAYQFIIKTVSKKKNEYFILLNNLKCSKLSADSVVDAFNKRKERFQFMPELDISVDEVTDGEISFLRIKADKENDMIQNSLSEGEKEKQLADIELLKLKMKIKIDNKLMPIKLIEFPNFCKEIPTDICKGMNYLQKVIIPLSTHTIGEGAFRDCKSLNEIIIPSTITEIRDNAFLNCPNLKRINLPSSIMSIGKSCFSHCTSLCRMEIPPSIFCISDNLFHSCTSLVNVQLPSCVKYIGPHAFSNCSKLEIIALPIALETIGEGAFCFCKRIPQFEIPSSVAVIEKNAFKGCELLTKLKIPHSVRFIGECAFQECRLLLQIEIMGQFETIEASTFYNCSNLMLIELPLSITTIDKYAFYSLMNLEEITLPSSVVWINDSAFRGCFKLKKIELPKNLKIIGNYAFYADEFSVGKVIQRNEINEMYKPKIYCLNIQMICNQRIRIK